MNRATLTFCYASIVLLCGTAATIAFGTRGSDYQLHVVTERWGETPRTSFVLENRRTGELQYVLPRPRATAQDQH